MIFVLGLSHHTAPVALRELLQVDTAALLNALRDVTDEALVLSTCNRLEIYGVADSHVEAFITGWLAEYSGLRPDVLRQHLFSLSGVEAVQHIMRVAGGLESMILGEAQILGQLSQALEKASAGAMLHRLVMDSLHVGKQIRTHTGLNQGTLSVSHAAARLVPKAARVLIIGAGDMAGQAILALHSRGGTDLHVINRTFDKAQALNATPHHWAELHEQVSLADVVIAATGAPYTLLHAEDFHNCIGLKPRCLGDQTVGFNPMTSTSPPSPLSASIEGEQNTHLLIDLGVPRNIEPNLRQLPNITLYDIDQLQDVVDENLAARQAHIPQAEAMIADAVQSFMDWLAGRQVTDLITALRSKVQHLIAEELNSTLHRLEHLPEDDKAVLRHFAHRVTNKVLHEPTQNLRALDDAQWVWQLFALEVH